MASINYILSLTHPLAVAMLLLTSVWAISFLVGKRRLCLGHSSEHHPVPVLPVTFQGSRLTQFSPIAHLEKESPETNDTRKTAAQLEGQSSPISIPRPASTCNNSTQLPIIVHPWRGSFSLSPRDTPTDTSSANGRKGSFCPLSLESREAETESRGQRSPESELAGIGGQFTVLKLQDQGRQLSFS
ncbi:hypothetical protein QBC34DRAFT_92649 [Podospora aff. communis PSN243]|uniref:Uncharacterized protein n=1 Tax=Podospora aff. communis PSN243 TaxID=3040156 RepID=A0AAV9GLW8_9PEZI|nr:hypothetical protein QBC34DRAFT_92649 [Podospora aff. communis PSN243]